MNKFNFIMWKVFKMIILIALAVVMYGIVTPAWVSAKSVFLPIVGFLLIPGTILIIIFLLKREILWLVKKIKGEDENEKSK